MHGSAAWKECKNQYKWLTAFSTVVFIRKICLNYLLNPFILINQEKMENIFYGGGPLRYNVCTHARTLVWKSPPNALSYCQKRPPKRVLNKAFSNDKRHLLRAFCIAKIEPLTCNTSSSEKDPLLRVLGYKNTPFYAFLRARVPLFAENMRFWHPKRVTRVMCFG